MDSKIREKIETFRRKRDNIREFIYFYVAEEERLFQNLLKDLELDRHHIDPYQLRNEFEESLDQSE